MLKLCTWNYCSDADADAKMDIEPNLGFIHTERQC